MDDIKLALMAIKANVNCKLESTKMMLEDKDDYVLTATNTLRLQGEIEAYYNVLDEIKKIADLYGVKL